MLRPRRTRFALATAAIGLSVACDPAGPHADPLEPRDGPVCGDGIVDAGEACDLGFANRPDGPCRACRRPSCGDGVRDPGEECDDATDACTPDCRATLAEVWSRRFSSRASALRVSDVVFDDGGDAFIVGWRDDRDEGVVRPFVARYDPGGDVRWRVDLAEPGVAHAIARRSDGDLVVVLTRASGPERPGDVHVVKLARADGRVLLELGPFGEPGMAAAIATSGDAAFVAYNAESGPGRVVALDAAGAVASTDAIAEVPLANLRALATAPGGDLVVAGGDAEASTGFVARVNASGDERYAVRDLDGPVLDVVTEGDVAFAAITARVHAPEPEAPWSWTTAVDVVALGGDGQVLWSTRQAPERGRREAGALAIADDRVLVVGTDPMPVATCSPLHCEQRPWATALDRDTGEPRWSLVLLPEVQGRAHAVALHEDAVAIGGELRPLFSPGEAWVSWHREASP